MQFRHYFVLLFLLPIIPCTHHLSAQSTYQLYESRYPLARLFTERYDSASGKWLPETDARWYYDSENRLTGEDLWSWEQPSLQEGAYYQSTLSYNKQGRIVRLHINGYPAPLSSGEPMQWLWESQYNNNGCEIEQTAWEFVKGQRNGTNRWTRSFDAACRPLTVIRWEWNGEKWIELTRQMFQYFDAEHQTVEENTWYQDGITGETTRIVRTNNNEGRLIREQTYWPDEAEWEWDKKFQYDAAGNLVKEELYTRQTEPDTTDWIQQSITISTYDERNNRLTFRYENWENGRLIRYQINEHFNQHNLPIRRETKKLLFRPDFPDSIVLEASLFYFEYTYFCDDSLKSAVVLSGEAKNPVYRTTYGYITPDICPQSIDSFPIDIYPNPADEVLILRSPWFDAETVTLELFDVSGRRLLQRTGSRTGDIRLSVRHLSAGMYVLHLRSANQRSVQKVLIGH